MAYKHLGIRFQRFVYTDCFEQLESLVSSAAPAQVRQMDDSLNGSIRLLRFTAWLLKKLGPHPSLSKKLLTMCLPSFDLFSDKFVKLASNKTDNIHTEAGQDDGHVELITNSDVVIAKSIPAPQTLLILTCPHLSLDSITLNRCS